MNKLSMIALACALTASGAAYAQTQNDQNIKSDVQSINEDNATIQHHSAELQQDKNATAADQANKAYGSSAVDSAKAVGQKAAIETDKGEKAVHQKMLKHHKQKAADEANANTTPAQ